MGMFNIKTKIEKNQLHLHDLNRIDYFENDDCDLRSVFMRWLKTPPHELKRRFK